MKFEKPITKNSYSELEKQIKAMTAHIGILIKENSKLRWENEELKSQSMESLMLSIDSNRQLNEFAPLYTVPNKPLPEKPFGVKGIIIKQ